MPRYRLPAKERRARAARLSAAHSMAYSKGMQRHIRRQKAGLVRTPSGKLVRLSTAQQRAQAERLRRAESLEEKKKALEAKKKAAKRPNLSPGEEFELIEAETDTAYELRAALREYGVGSPQAVAAQKRLNEIKKKLRGY